MMMMMKLMMFNFDTFISVPRIKCLEFVFRPSFDMSLLLFVPSDIHNYIREKNSGQEMTGQDVSHVALIKVVLSVDEESHWVENTHKKMFL